MTRDISILLPAARRAAPGEEQTCWGDLRVALASVAAYAPGIDVVVGWSGSEEPRDLPHNPCMRLLRQPESIRTGSEAWNWCSTQTTAEYLFILGDDNVLHPDTVTLLVEDMTYLTQAVPGGMVGMVAARSNYVKGPQNVRSPNGDTSLSLQFPNEETILESQMVVPVAALVRHDVYDLTNGFPPTNWFADDVFCWDLNQRGYAHYVSRAYVHHVGQRATAQGKSSEILLQEGRAWLEANRPDFLNYMQAMRD